VIAGPFEGDGPVDGGGLATAAEPQAAATRATETTMRGRVGFDMGSPTPVAMDRFRGLRGGVVVPSGTA